MGSRWAYHSLRRAKQGLRPSFSSGSSRAVYIAAHSMLWPLAVA